MKTIKIGDTISFFSRNQKRYEVVMLKNYKSSTVNMGRKNNKFTISRMLLTEKKYNISNELPFFNLSAKKRKNTWEKNH